jgi:hypothetical protein
MGKHYAVSEYDDDELDADGMVAISFRPTVNPFNDEPSNGNGFGHAKAVDGSSNGSFGGREEGGGGGGGGDGDGGGGRLRDIRREVELALAGDSTGRFSGKKEQEKKTKATAYSPIAAESPGGEF